MNIRKVKSQDVSQLPGLSGPAAYNLAQINWSQTLLGPPDTWPGDLHSLVELCFRSAQPSALIWGEEQGHIFNEAWARCLAGNSWEASGRAFTTAWAAVWPDCQLLYERAQAGESAVSPYTQVFVTDPEGRLRERYFSFAATPTGSAPGATNAVLITAHDATRECLAERRVRILRELANQYRELDSIEANCQWFLETLVDHAAEVPFAAVYWLEAEGRRARQLCSAGLTEGSDALPTVIELTADKPNWLFAETVQRDEATVLTAGPGQLDSIMCAPYPEPIQSAIIYPITTAGEDLLPAVLLMAASPRLPLDEDYRGFFTLLGIAFRQLMSGAYTRFRWEEANAALIANEKRYRAIVEGQSEMVCRFRADGAIVFANGAYARARGATPEQVEGSDFRGLIANEDRPAVEELLAQIRPDKPEVFSENRVEIQGQNYWTRWSNRALSFDEQGRPTEIQSVGMDITDRRRAELALQDREEQLRLALQGANAGAWSLEVATGSTFWSQEFRSLYGYPADMEPKFSTWINSIHSDDRAWVKRAFRARPYSTSSEYQQEFRIMHPQRGERWVLALGRVERDLEGRAQGVSGINIDITERKSVEQALRHSEERLKEADRHKDEFLATLAHELRNPLAPMGNALEIMRLAGDDKNAVDKARAIMERQLAHMVHLINDLLDLSRISRGKINLRKSRVPIAGVLEQAVEICRPLIDAAGHTLTMNLPGDAVYVNADQARLSQVFANLLSNAAKFTPDGGRIDLTVERRGNWILVRVKDNGAGISAAMLDKIFDMFMQGEAEQYLHGGGLGIGLSLVRGMVEMHGGRVEAHSAGLDQGSEFIVHLPLAPLSKTRQTEPEARQAGSAHGLRILVVDDNQDAANSMATMLELMGHDSRVAYDGLEALDVASEFHPDIVLLDLGMPKLNGYNTARRMRQQSWGTQVKLIALTGWGQAEDRRRSKEAGFDSHLVKPVDLAMLRELLEV